MSVFRLECEVVNISDLSRSSIVPQLLVDTGSELTWLPEAVLHQVGIRVVKKDLPLLVANGQTITRSTGQGARWPMLIRPITSQKFR